MTSAEDGRKISISDVLNGSCDRCLRVNLRPSRSRMKLWMLLRNPALQNGMKTRKKQNCNDHILKEWAVADIPASHRSAFSELLLD